MWTNVGAMLDAQVWDALADACTEGGDLSAHTAPEPCTLRDSSFSRTSAHTDRRTDGLSVCLGPQIPPGI